MKVYSHYRLAGNSRNYKIKTPGHRMNVKSVKRAGLIFFTITAIILLLLKLTTWLGAQELFELKEVKVEGNKYLQDKEILSYLKLDSLNNIFDLDLRIIENQIKQHPLIRKVSVSRQFPAILKIVVYEREPIAAVNQSELYVIDENGNRLPKVTNLMLSDLPIISNAAPQESAASHQDEILAFLNYTKQHLFQLYSRISEISYSKSLGVYFYLMDQSVPVIVGHNTFSQKSKNLMEVLNILDNEDHLQKIQYLDLRFNDQVIVKQG